MSTEYIHPTQEGRRNLIALILFSLVAAIAIEFWLLPAFFAHLHSLPKCNQWTWLRAILLSVIFFPPLVALWAIPHSLRLLKLNQFPLPGVWVLRLTPIQRGRPVRIRAIALLLLSALALAFPLLGLHLLESTPFSYSRKSCAFHFIQPDRHGRASHFQDRRRVNSGAGQ